MSAGGSTMSARGSTKSGGGSSKSTGGSSKTARRSSTDQIGPSPNESTREQPPVALRRTVRAPIGGRIQQPRRRHGLRAVLVLPELHRVVRQRQPRTAEPVDLVIAVGLGGFVDVVVRHGGHPGR